MPAMSRRRTGPVAARGGLYMVARVVSAITGIVVGLILVGIVLVLLEANTGNDIVNWFVDAARWLAGPFDNMFKLDDRKANVAVNWGLGALVYGLVGGLIVRLLRR